jgi:hypothetical protein
VADSEVATALYNNAVHNNVAAQIWWSKLALRHQMLDEHGKPTSPVINYTGRPAKDEDQ